MCGDLECVEFLIENQANIRHQDLSKWTPLHHAANHGHLDVVHYLIQNGASIDATNKWGDNPLRRASDSRYAEVVQYLLAMGADNTIPDTDGKTPLMIAEELGNIEMTELLRRYTFEKVEIGKQRRQMILRKLGKERLQELQQEVQDNDPLCFDGIFIQSSEEIKLVIDHLEKQLELFWFSDNNLGLDSNNIAQKQWLKINKRRCDKLVSIHQAARLPSLEKLMRQIDDLKHEMNQNTTEDFAAWSTKIGRHDPRDEGVIVQLGLDHIADNSKMEKEISNLYSICVSAQHALEQRCIAMGQM